MNSEKRRRMIRKFQRLEKTAEETYLLLAKTAPPNNKKVLKKIAGDERRHYDSFKKYTGRDMPAFRIKKIFYFIWGKIFGLTFVIKILEKEEAKSQREYTGLKNVIKEINAIIRDEKRHEKEFVKMLEEEKLSYIGSMMLGLNDALVELTGALAGFTFAIRNTEIIAAAGLITGIAASFSMAASEYLSQKAEGSLQSPLKAAMYTGGMYLTVVVILILPFLIFEGPFFSLGISLAAVFIIILLFTFFESVVQEKVYKKVFFEMFLLCFAVILLSFIVGTVARRIFGIDI